MLSISRRNFLFAAASAGAVVLAPRAAGAQGDTETIGLPSGLSIRLTDPLGVGSRLFLYLNPVGPAGIPLNEEYPLKPSVMVDHRPIHVQNRGHGLYELTLVTRDNQVEIELQYRVSNGPSVVDLPPATFSAGLLLGNTASEYYEVQTEERTFAGASKLVVPPGKVFDGSDLLEITA